VKWMDWDKKEHWKWKWFSYTARVRERFILCTRIFAAIEFYREHLVCS